jgi:iron complex transport system substrate-binding protein
MSKAMPRGIGSVIILTIGLNLIGCVQSSPPVNTLVTPEATAPSFPHSTNCVNNYNPDIDYFPDKVVPAYAQGFSVDYHNHYKVVTVKNPWKDATVTFEYVLVQCGTPEPEGLAEAQIIAIPVDRVVSLSTTHLPHLEKLDLLPHLVGVSSAQQVSSAAVRAKLDRGEAQGVGSGSTLNLELLLSLEPGLVTTFGTGNPDRDAFPKLAELAVPTAVIAEYMEPSALGQAEWLKFTALFFNQEAQAQALFGTIAQDYETMANQVRTALASESQPPKRPKVLVGFSQNGTWYVPGGRSYVAQLLRDAGADYVWAGDQARGSLPLAFEVVFDRGVNADFWINGSQDWRSLEDAIATDPRYGEFAALQQGNIYNNDARLNPTGGNDYWESGIISPHLILADLIKIFHPDLLPDHQFVYYRKL